VYAMDSARLPSGYAVSGIAARVADSVEMRLSVTRDPSGEFVDRRSVKRPVGLVHELPALATDAILAMLGRPRAAAAARAAPTRDSIAYDLFLKGRYQTDRRTEAATQRAVALFRAAVARDSNFAEGWAGLARALQQVHLRRYRIPGIPTDDSVLAVMYAASDRALEADSTRSYVWIARGLTFRDLDPGSRRNAVLAFERAIALDSTNADAWHYAAVAWEDSLEPARALASWRRTVRIDPTHRQALGFLAQHYNWMRQYDSALAWADSGRRIDPTHILSRQQMGLAHAYSGDTTGAAEIFRATIALGKGPDEVTGWVGLASLALRGRDRRAADTLFAHALALADTLHPTLHDAAYVAWGYLAFGDTSRALRVLERYDPRVDMHFQLHLHCDPGLDGLRALPRFRALLVRRAAPCLK
jgi:tetratricopeptide (TPR) repeat protein